MTVARLGENTIQVRLGAMSGNREDVMIPRTYNVTALVLFPTAESGGSDDAAARGIIPCSQALFHAQTTLRHARTGKQARTVIDDAIVKPFRRFAGVSREVAAAALEKVRDDDYSAFPRSSRPAPPTFGRWPSA